MKVRNQELHSKIIDFIEEVKKQKGASVSNYLDIAKRHIYNIGDALGIKTDFLRYCESLEFFESILYQLPGYRSHFVHQLNVFLNGYLILNRLDDEQFKKIKEIIAQRCEVSEDLIDIFKIWFITAIFHDTGYPLGKVGDLTQNFMEKIFNRKFDQIPSAVVGALSVRLFRETFRESLNLLIQHLSTWLDPSESNRRKISHEIHELFFEDLSENLIPGLLLIKANETSSIDICTLSTAISAIVLDDERMWEILKNKKIKNQISYVDHPLAFLLVYCDNIQEYGRPKSVLRSQIVEREFKLPKIDEFAVKKQDLSLKKDTIHCSLIYEKQPKIWDEKVKRILKSIREYWKSPSDLAFSISYATESEDFDNLTFLKVSAKSR